MTVAFDATAAATTNTGGGISSQSWTHTPVGTPAAVVVMVQLEDTATAAVTGVTYGGVAMTMDASSPNDGGEGPTGARQYVFYLLAGIPTGAQTVVTTFSVSLASAGNSRSVTFTGATTLELHARAVSNTTTANPKISVACTHDSVVVGMLNSGQDTAAAVTVDANTTGFGGVIDVGATQHAFARKTANTSTTDGPGWTVASSAALMYAVAVAEVVSATTGRAKRREIRDGLIRSGAQQSSRW